jgi:F0F1-type ATP synthase assembly protein I
VDLRDKRELNRGMGQALSQAFEFAATSAIFGLIGWWIDRRLGTQPLFIIVLTVACLVGQFAKVWYAYNAEMDRHDARLPARQMAAAEQARTAERSR